MKKRSTILLITLCLFGFSAFSQETAEQKFKKLNWLEGQWKRTNVKPERTAGEDWKKVNDHYLKGTGYTIAKQDTVFKEGLEILIKDNALFYVATVTGNAKPVYFKFTELTADSFVCENAENDFPKKIAYKITGNTIKATISGGGNPVDFVFVRK